MAQIEHTFGCKDTLVMSWTSTRVQVMKKMLRRQDGSGAYQMYIKMIPTKQTTYAVVANNITWIWLHVNWWLMQTFQNMESFFDSTKYGILSLILSLINWSTCFVRLFKKCFLPSFSYQHNGQLFNIQNQWICLEKSLKKSIIKNYISNSNLKHIVHGQKACVSIFL